MEDLSGIIRINAVKILKGVWGGGGVVGNSSEHKSWWHCYYMYIIFYRDVTQLEIHLD